MDTDNNITAEKCWKSKGVFGTGICENLDEYGHCAHCPKYSKAGRLLLDRPISDASIEEWTKIIATPKTEAQDYDLSLVVFRLSGELLALDARCLQEAVNVRKVHRVPHRTNDIFRGIVNINGELLMCVSVKKLLGLADAGQEESKRNIERMLVVHDDKQRYAFRVDEMHGVVKLDSASLTPAPVTLSNQPLQLINSIFAYHGEKSAYINANNFFEALDGRMDW